MTIAAILSRKLHETFGDEAAETMIDWMQSVNTHRSELRELSDLAFDRFDARFGERLSELREELRQEFRNELRAEGAAIRIELNARIDHVSAKIDGLGERLETRYADLIKWSFAFWVGSTVTLMLGMAAILRIGR